MKPKKKVLNELGRLSPEAQSLVREMCSHAHSYSAHRWREALQIEDLHLRNRAVRSWEETQERCRAALDAMA